MSGAERGGGHLVQEGLEQMMVGAIHHRHADGSTREGARRRHAAESRPDDDHVRHGAALIPSRYPVHRPLRSRAAAPCTG